MSNLDAFKDQLIKMRVDFTERVNAIEIDVHHKDEPVEKDFAEQATQSENDDVLVALDNESKQTIIRIDSALLRISNDTYGICTECGKAISKKRLEAVPYAELCIECAENAAR